jgi:hypothetical protein
MATPLGAKTRRAAPANAMKLASANAHRCGCSVRSIESVASNAQLAENVSRTVKLSTISAPNGVADLCGSSGLTASARRPDGLPTEPRLIATTMTVRRIEPERGDILETKLESEERKSKSENGIAGVRGRDSRRTLVDRKLLS